jgi:hypothetical protein
VYNRIKLQVDLQADKSPVVVKGPFFPRVVNPRYRIRGTMSYGPPWAHYLSGYQDRLLGGPLGLPGLHYTAPDGVEHKDNRGEVLG